MSIEVTPGLGPQNLEGDPNASGSFARVPASVYVSPLLDLTIPVSNMEVIPAIPSHVPQARASGSLFFLIEDVAGTQVTPAVVRAGSDSGHVNYLSQQSAPSNADVNGANPPSYTTNNLTLPAITSTIASPNQPVFLDVVSGASGTDAFRCMARLVLVVYWVPVS